MGISERGLAAGLADPDRAGGGTVTLSVSDLNSHLLRLEQLEIRVIGRNESDTTSVAIVQDPDGNQIILAEPLTSEMGR